MQGQTRMTMKRVRPREPDIIQSKLSRRLLYCLVACSLLIPLYAATWHSSSEGTTNYVQRQFGRLADLLVQAFILFALLLFLAVVAPDDLEAPEARKYIGYMLIVSNLSGTYAAYAHARALQLARASVVATWNEFVCLYVQYTMSLFYWLLGVVYPTVTFFCLHNSWQRCRTGMVVDSCVFLCGIAVLHAHGETCYPPGDAPLAAAFGRPVVALLGAAVFAPANRHRLALWAQSAGLFHVRLTLEELRDNNLRPMLARVGVGFPGASGNTTEGSLLSIERTSSVSRPPSRSQPRASRSRSGAPSHHTAKWTGDDIFVPVEVTGEAASEVAGALIVDVSPSVAHPRRSVRSPPRWTPTPPSDPGAAGLARRAGSTRTSFERPMSK